ncbi:MAG: penicillin-binding protein 1B [Woeseiaceae bacterium]
MAKKRASKKKKTSTRKKTPASKGKKRARRKPKRSWWRRHPIWTLLLLGLLCFAIWMLTLDFRITRAFESRRWDLPARVFAAPTELYAGRQLRLDQLEQLLRQLGYRSVADPAKPGQFRRTGDVVQIHRRAASFWDGREAETIFTVRFASSKVASLTSNGAPLSMVRLDPLVIGSVFPAHGEDRLVLAPDEVPRLLRDTLLLVEDRRFFEHFGLDVRSIARAAWVNLRSGRVQQGGSTLTQQLVKSYFLTNERTYSRKIREALMSIILELRFDKQDILTAYVNEIYMGQDGVRAVHGFALASQFYFAKPLAELDAAEVALLVAIVRGPSYYAPSRFTERVQQRRDRILQSMTEAGVIDDGVATRAMSQPVSVASRDAERANYHPAFVELVRRQLARDYASDDLQKEGLQIHTTMDPLAQMVARRALAGHLDRLRSEGGSMALLQGAVVVADPTLGDVQALVGSRDRVGSGFNRALDAKRQVGSLIKPVVFLAALQAGQKHMASIVDDEPITVAGDDGKQWSPNNFSETFAGPVPLYRVLAESINVATVRLGLDTGVRAVAATLARLGGPVIDDPFPSLLLGAVEMSPMEVAHVYLGLASDGLRPPLRSVREVVAPDGDTVSRYPLQVDTVAGSDVLYQLQTAMRQVMSRGTGRSAGNALQDIETAGKTGTTNDYRDAWFAGFSADRLAVVWVGNDDNSSTGLTGSRGALPVWTDIMKTMGARSLTLRPPSNSRSALVDYASGAETDSRCREAVPVGVPKDAVLDQDKQCGRDGFTGRALRWLKDTF